MAQSEGENDCDMDQEATKQEYSEKDESECDRTVSSSGATSTGATTARPSKGAGSSSGAASKSRRSRRKQSDPRRVGSEIVKMEVVEIKSEIIDQDDSDSNEKDPEDNFDDDVFLKVRTNALSPNPGTPTSSERLEGSLVHDQSRVRIGDRRDVLQTEVDNGDDCQPQDLSMSSKKRDHNRVVLAIPSVVRPTKPKGTQRDLGRRNESDSANASTHSQISQNNAHVFRTFAHDLQAEGLVGLERDYRLKYRHDFDDDYHESHSHAINPHQEYPTPLPFAIAHQHKVILDSQECNSQDIACGDHKETNGKTSPSTSTSSSSSTSQSSKSTNKPGRSYKNLSRSRRIVANARERNRVHTISAAFEGLRRAVPSYSHNQKLSKLAILRIACSYILALAKLADLDYSPEDEQQMSFEDCVDLCTETLQAEGRSKRRKGPLE